jgi:hypothetical protein
MSWPFETMTEQEVFDKVAKHLLTQNAKSKLPSGMCAYRGDHGLMCAAGCLIPDDKYDPAINLKAWHELTSSNVVSSHCGELIQSLQGVHDDWPVDNWKSRLAVVASKYNLEFKFDNFVPGEEA